MSVNTNWMKFGFLATVMILALFGERSGASTPRAPVASVATAYTDEAPPLLALDPPAGRATSAAAASPLAPGAPFKTADAKALAAPFPSVENSDVAEPPPLIPVPRVAAAPASSDGSTLDAESDVSTGFYLTGSVPAPETGAHTVYVADIGGNAYLDVSAEMRWPTASLTKLMTAVVTLEHGGLTDDVTVPASAAGLDESRTILHAGDAYTAADLLRIMLTYSSNAAAETLAAHYGRAGFLADMNAQARDWGMGDTYYNDASGLSSANQSTGRDFATLARHVYAAYPQIFAITRTPAITATELNSKSTLRVKNINLFAGESDFIGGKTGYTDDADGNLLSVFTYRGRPLVIVVLGTADSDRFTDTKAILDWFEKNYR